MSIEVKQTKQNKTLLCIENLKAQAIKKLVSLSQTFKYY